MFRFTRTATTTAAYNDLLRLFSTTSAAKAVNREMASAKSPPYMKPDSEATHSQAEGLGLVSRSCLTQLGEKAWWTLRNTKGAASMHAKGTISSKWKINNHETPAERRTGPSQ